MAQLNVTDASGRQAQHPLEARMPCMIGRAPDNQIVLDDPRASRHHAHVKANADGAFMIVDGVSVAVASDRGDAASDGDGDGVHGVEVAGVFPVIELSARSGPRRCALNSRRKSGRPISAMTINLWDIRSS